MNHFDEMLCLLYLEGQLDPSRAQEVAAHAGECTQCRKLLHALERESRVLSAALTEENEPLPARLLSMHGWGVPSWVWTLAFGLFIAGAYWLWTDTIVPWFNQLGNAGFGETDLVSTLLFSGAFWEGWSDMINVIEISALVILGIAAFGLIRRRLRRFTSLAVVISLLALALALPQPAGAAEFRRGRSVLIPVTETVHTDLIVTGPSVRIDGTVEGDVIAFSRNLTVTGHVTGDIIAFAGQMRVDGEVDGNIRVISSMVTLEGSVGKNVTSIANTLDLTSKGQVGGGLISVGGQTTLDGRIHRDLFGIIGRTYLDGTIGGQMWLRGGSLTVTSTAEIGGPAVFRGREKPVIATGAKLASPIRVETAQEVRRSRRSSIRLAIHQIFRYGAALLIGILMVTVLPGFFRVTMRETGRIGLPIGVGVLALIIGTFLLVLGILLMFVGVGAGVAGVLGYAPILYIAQVFVGAWLGNKVLGETSNTASAVIGRMALGLFILHVAGLIHVVGALVWMTVLLWGTGAILLGLYQLSRAETAALAG
jgi:cytoskeletal protein CcmA (bactofilin family)